MNDSMCWFMGVIESLDDPGRMNRVKVRCVGHHTEDKSLIPTAALPWAPVITNTSNMSAPNFVNGDWVIGFFLDGKKAQQPVVFGVIHGIPKEMRSPDIGFSDPDGVYPNRIGEPTTPRNVNGTNINATNVAWQTTSCVRDVTTANGSNWSEPATAYNAVYPHNHAIQSSREHIIELDDTMGHERVLVFHRRGSFIEMHPNGEIVIRSMGNHSLVVHGDANIYSSGDTNISAGGNVSVLANGDTSISTKGNASWKVGGNMRLDIGGHLDFAVKNDWNAGAGGAMRLVASSSAFVQGTRLFLNSTPTTFFSGGAPNPTGSAQPPVNLSVSAAPAFEAGAFEDDLSDKEATSARGASPPATTALPEGKTEGATSNPSANPAAPIPTHAPSLDRSNVLNTRIGKYYTVGDLVMPGHDILNPTPAGLTTEEVVENLNALAINILDPLRDAGINFNINSGFRQRKGGAASARPDFGNHAYGYAVDLGFQGISSAWQGANRIYPIIGARCSQFMLEYGSGSGWVHVTFVPPGKSMAPRAGRIDKETWILSPFQRRQGLVDQRPNETKKFSGQA
ncbi:MAG: hypothetical protein DDT26_00659 [Dehalococcoidia bacterium]|nr:hypothetical protein [Chloroflexota bacterium]